MTQLRRRWLEGNDDAASLFHFLDDVSVRQRALPRIVFALGRLHRLFRARFRRLSAIGVIVRGNASLAVLHPLDPENLLLQTVDILRRGRAQSTTNLPGFLVSLVQRREKVLLLLRQR